MFPNYQLRDISSVSPRSSSPSGILGVTSLSTGGGGGTSTTDGVIIGTGDNLASSVEGRRPADGGTPGDGAASAWCTPSGLGDASCCCWGCDFGGDVGVGAGSVGTGGTGGGGVCPGGGNLKFFVIVPLRTWPAERFAAPPSSASSASSGIGSKRAGRWAGGDADATRCGGIDWRCATDAAEGEPLAVRGRLACDIDWGRENWPVGIGGVAPR